MANLSLEELASLARIANSEDWKAVEKMLDNRAEKDKNSIVSYPEDEPVKLAVKKSFYHGRINAVNLIKDEINKAPSKLERVREKE